MVLPFLTERARVAASLGLFCQIYPALASLTVLVLINFDKICGCVAVPVNGFFDIISTFFAKFKNVVHSLEPGETPSYSASHQSPNYVQRS